MGKTDVIIANSDEEISKEIVDTDSIIKKVPSIDKLTDIDAENKENEKVKLDESMQETRAIDNLIEEKIDVVTPATKMRSTEWRDKLRQELLDDISFDDVTSDDDVTSSCGDDVTSTMTSLPTLVVDMGSYEIRSGFSPAFQPQLKYRSVIGRWRSDVTEVWRENEGDFLFGENAIRKHQSLNLKEIYTNGIVNNWRDVTSL